MKHRNARLNQLSFACAELAGKSRRDSPRRWWLHVAEKRGTAKAMPDGPLTALVKQTEYTKAQIRARVQH